jgi:preprotein translocase subunit SecA
MLDDEIVGVLDEHDEDLDVDLIFQDLWRVFLVPETITPDTLAEMDVETMEEVVRQAGQDAFHKKEEQFNALDPQFFVRFMRQVFLRVLDMHWQRHLTGLDALREGIGLMSIAQQDPLVAYKRQGFEMFNEMRATVAEEAVRQLMMVQPVARQPLTVIQAPKQLRMIKPSATPQAAAEEPAKQTVRADRQRPGRNDPCWCGSGKKYKSCHMREDEMKSRSTEA